MHSARVLPHIKRLDDCFGQFLVRVSCPCGTSRHVEPEALARLVGLVNDSRAARPTDALLAVREEGRGGRGSCEAEATGHPEESALSTLAAKHRSTLLSRLIKPNQREIQ
jgi:hypothetical protein